MVNRGLTKPMTIKNKHATSKHAKISTLAQLNSALVQDLAKAVAKLNGFERPPTWKLKDLKYLTSEIKHSLSSVDGETDEEDHKKMTRTPIRLEFSFCTARTGRQMRHRNEAAGLRNPSPAFVEGIMSQN
ncbi:hypothetical protein GH733_019088 [Mirounga leonina]|nr:hypothetical protein GH733_019088 [Mirounga leonina]